MTVNEMNAQSQFYVPEESVLLELGRLQVLHGHLDHTLRLAIKRMIGISIDDPGYWSETRGMAAALRDRVRELIAERYKSDEDTSDVLNRVLDDAEQATMLRNRALHSVWMQAPGEIPVLHDRDNALKQHVAFPPPTAAELAGISERIGRILHTLNYITRKLL